MTESTELTEKLRELMREYPPHESVEGSVNRLIARYNDLLTQSLRLESVVHALIKRLDSPNKP
jgi:uncharacterized membrane protein YheB (UPF0754 family)